MQNVSQIVFVAWSNTVLMHFRYFLKDCCHGNNKLAHESINKNCRKRECVPVVTGMQKKVNSLYFHVQPSLTCNYTLLGKTLFDVGSFLTHKISSRVSTHLPKSGLCWPFHIIHFSTATTVWISWHSVRHCHYNVDLVAFSSALPIQWHLMALDMISKITITLLGPRQRNWRYFSWLLLCDRACPAQPPALFLSRVLLLGFGKVLSIKKKCHCRFVVMCVGFITNCQNKSRSKSLPPDIHPLLFLHATTHTVALAGMRTSLVLFTIKITSRHARSYSRTQSGVIQHLAQTRVSRRNDIKISVVEQPAQSPESWSKRKI